MTKFKAVLFDIGGVILPQPQQSIAKYGSKLELPKRFLPELFLQSLPHCAFQRLERGELTLKEFYLKFEMEAKQKAKAESLILPKEFSAEDLFKEFAKKDDSFPVNKSMLAASTHLRKSGLLTCVITNNWIDDDEKQKLLGSKLLMILKLYFNEVIESARIGIRKPTPAIYQLACHRLGVHPAECIFLDDLGQNLKAANALGIKTIKVIDPNEALKELHDLTGVNVLNGSIGLVYPAPCEPFSAVHGYVQVKKDIKLHFVECGSGPTVVFLHGFPDTWYCWRHQIPALAAAGYRAVALDQRGFGESSTPLNISDYRQEELAFDVITVMDRLGINLATVVGHDWGGALAWNIALKFPDKFIGVCGVNTPFFKINPNHNPLVSMHKNPGVFDYQLYFQEPGVAEKEFEADVSRTLRLIFQGYGSKMTHDDNVKITSRNVRERGGLFVGVKDAPRSSFLTSQDLDYYTNAFSKSGFRGALNWYRNYDNNWNWMRPIAHRKITIPALMVTASHDQVLKPSFSFGMEDVVINLKRLHIEKCGHWTPQEKPNELNDGLIKWLDEINHQMMVPSKL